MVNWGAAVPIVVAIIGISGVVLPALSSVFINQVYNKPNVNIDIGTKLENGKQVINITNSGTIPATNLSLIITANNHIITDITNLLSTTNVFLVSPGPPSLLEINRLKSINGLYLELHITKVVSGRGSIIKLAVGTKDTTLKNYVVYATYDQGSIEEPSSQDFVTSYFTFGFKTGLIYGIIAYSIVGFFLLYKVKIYVIRQFLQKITKEMMDVRTSLRRNPSDRNTFGSQWATYHISRPSNETWKKGPGTYFLDSRKVVKEISDYIRVDDFYSKLVERDSYIEKKIPSQVIDNSKLAKLNKQCLELAEDALTKIDWSKYR